MIDIRHGDSIQTLAGITPDVVIVDPPYREHVHAAATSCGTPGARPSKARKGAAHRDLGFVSLGDPLRDFVCALAARTKRWSVIYTDAESVGAWKDGLEAAGATYIRSMPWIRWSMPQLSGDRPPQGHEMIVLAWGSTPGKKSWNGPGNLTHVTHVAHTCMRGDGKHKTQKPLDQVLDFVEFFSESGELVCDPCMGSGTTALACLALGRNFVGSELDVKWVEQARLRVSGTVAMYDDEARYQKFIIASQARAVDMKRMADNTARIAANRAAQT